jgi:hypothetical protein
MIVKDNTPWEDYDVGGRRVWVKREDLCCPPPGPPFSKIRGVERAITAHLARDFIPESVGVVDSVHSKAGWAVAYVCREFGLPCHVYYPKLKAEVEGYVRPYQQKAREMGAVLHALPATMSSVLFYQARKMYFDALVDYGYFMPNGLRLRETILQTANEVCRGIPDMDVLKSEAVWVVSVSSGTIAAGVASGLERLSFMGTLVLHLGFSRSEKNLLHYVKSWAPNVRTVVVDGGYQYAEAIQGSAPFPCNPYYDLKAWEWLKPGIQAFRGSIVFWNIGA